MADSPSREANRLRSKGTDNESVDSLDSSAASERFDVTAGRSYAKFLECLPESVRQFFNEDGTAREWTGTTVPEIDLREYAAKQYDLFGSEGSEVFAVRLEGLQDELAIRMSRQMLLNEEKTQVAAIKLNILVAELTASVEAFHQTKKQVDVAKSFAAQNGDYVLELERKRKFIKEVDQILGIIDSLRTLQRHASQALEESNLSKAHNLCKQYDALISSELFSSSLYRCMTSTSEKIAHVAVESLRQLHGSLQPICLNFDGYALEKVIVAYYDLRAGNELTTRLLNEFKQAIELAPANVTSSAVKRKPHPGRGGRDQESVGDRLLRTVEALIDALVSYHKAVQYEREASEKSSDPGLGAFKARLSKALDDEREAVWDTAERRLERETQILRDKLAALKPPSLVKAYSAALLFREFGAAFLSGTTAAVKGEYLVDFRNLAVKSFETMHNNNIDLIAVMLRNESWESAKVADQDLRTMRATLVYPAESDDGGTSAESVRKALEEGYNPIRRNAEIAAADAARKEAPLKDDLIDNFEHLDELEWAGSKVYTPTSLAMLRWLARYVQIARTLPPTLDVASEAVVELFLLYMYHGVELCNKRRAAARSLERAPVIENFLSRTESSTLAKLGAKYDRYNNQSSTFREEPPLQLPNLCVAVESMWTMSVMMEPLTNSIREKLRKEPNNRQSATLAGAWLLPKSIRRAAYALFSADISAGLVRAVSSSDYDLPDNKQESLKASKFVDYVNKRVSQTLAQKLPAESAEALSLQICKTIMRAYLEGIASIEKCSSPGRAQMLVDLRNLEMVLERSTGLKPIPELEKVQNYINAYYLSESELVDWVRDNAAKYKLNIKHVAALGEAGPGRSLTATEKYRLRERLVQECMRASKSKKSKASPATSSVASSSDDEGVSGSFARTTRTTSEAKSSRPPLLPKVDAGTTSVEADLPKASISSRPNSEADLLALQAKVVNGNDQAVASDAMSDGVPANVGESSTAADGLKNDDEALDSSPQSPVPALSTANESASALGEGISEESDVKETGPGSGVASGQNSGPGDAAAAESSAPSGPAEDDDSGLKPESLQVEVLDTSKTTDEQTEVPHDEAPNNNEAADETQEEGESGVEATRGTEVLAEESSPKAERVAASETVQRSLAADSETAGAGQEISANVSEEATQSTPGPGGSASQEQPAAVDEKVPAPDAADSQAVGAGQEVGAEVLEAGTQSTPALGGSDSREQPVAVDEEEAPAPDSADSEAVGAGQEPGAEVLEEATQSTPTPGSSEIQEQPAAVEEKVPAPDVADTETTSSQAAERPAEDSEATTLATALAGEAGGDDADF